MKQLVDFVEGRISFSDFRNLLESSTTIENYLKDDLTLTEGSYIGNNTYDHIINEGSRMFGHKTGWERIGTQLNIFGAVCQHLDRKGIPFKKTTVYEDKFGLLLDCQPAWLDIDEGFLNEVILAQAPAGLRKSQLKRWVKDQLRAMFRYASSSPKWIQNPEWPIINNKPLIFLCQQHIKDYFHDDAVVYVFIDESNGEIHTVLQLF